MTHEKHKPRKASEWKKKTYFNKNGFEKEDIVYTTLQEALDSMGGVP